MLSAKELLKQAQALNESKKYREVIELLADNLLEAHHNADLYAEIAEAYYMSEEAELCQINIQKGLLINPRHSKTNSYQGDLYAGQGNYEKAKECYNLAIMTSPSYADPYYGLGSIYDDLKEYERAKEFYNKAILANPSYQYSYNGLGLVYYNLKEYEKAKEYYNKAIEVNPLFQYPYNNLGNLYEYLKEYEKAKEYYYKAIELDPKDENPHNGLGNVYHDLKEYEKAKEYYSKAIGINPDFDASYVNLGNVHYDLKEYEKSKEYYDKYIDLTKNNPDYYTELAEERVIELAKQIKNSDYSTISEIVAKIKTLLLFDDGYITHYTGMSAARALIIKKDDKEESGLRLSEGAFLNDTSEGGELFKCLPALSVSGTGEGDAVAKVFVPKPFIGSFVTNARHDDLTLWRMYGKENKEEARGCSVTIDGAGLIEDLKKKLSPENNKGASAAFEDEFRFYRVAYISYGFDKKKSHFIIPDAKKGMEKKLAGHMGELHKAVEAFTAKYQDKEDTQDVLKKLNEIAYLFKSAAYQYEHEVRLIVSGTGFDKNINEDKTPPGVYIELVKITPQLKKITLGPKVERAEEWASAFYYSLDKQDLHPEILISHLPFK